MLKIYIVSNDCLVHNFSLYETALVKHCYLSSYNMHLNLLILFCACSFQQPGVTVVVSPLLSLIQDQIITLNLKFEIPATFLNSQ